MKNHTNYRSLIGYRKSCAELLAKQGHVVYGTSRKPQKAILENLTFLSCDVTDNSP